MSDDELRTSWRDIRTVFQDPFGSLNPRMTVGQIIGEPLLVQSELRGESALRTGWPAPGACRAAVQLHRPISACVLWRPAPTHQHSSGNRPDPRIIIADEATSALDVTVRTQILDLMLDLQERLQLSFILISHDIAVVRYFCDRVAVMHRGAIVETGETETVCSAPQHPYTVALLSAVPIADPRLRGTRQRLKYSA